MEVPLFAIFIMDKVDPSVLNKKGNVLVYKKYNKCRLMDVEKVIEIQRHCQRIP